MKNNNSRQRVFSSNQKFRQINITPRQSLAQLKERLKSKSSHYNIEKKQDRIRTQYNVQQSRQKLQQRQYKTNPNLIQKRRKQSLNQINQNIKFENQLRYELQCINETLKKCKNFQFQLQFQHYNKAAKIQTYKNKVVTYDSYTYLPSDILQLVQIQQIIKNRQLQIQNINLQISQLKQQFWLYNIHKQNLTYKSKTKPQQLQKFNPQRFTLADQIYSLNQQLKNLLYGHYNKKQQLQIMRTKINNSYRDYENQFVYKTKNDHINRHINNQNKNNRIQKSLIEDLNFPITYQEYKRCLKNKQRQNQLQKYKQKQTKQRFNNEDLSRIKSKNQNIPANYLQFSNISNISAILPSNLIDPWLKRQYLPGQIPQLPKQKNPNMKSMNYKKKVLLQALESQKKKYNKEMSQLVDKLLFLSDEDGFLSQQIDNLYEEINGLQQRFSYLELKSKIPNAKSKYYQKDQNVRIYSNKKQPLDINKGRNQNSIKKFIRNQGNLYTNNLLIPSTNSTNFQDQSTLVINHYQH